MRETPPLVDPTLAHAALLEFLMKVARQFVEVVLESFCLNIMIRILHVAGDLHECLIDLILVQVMADVVHGNAVEGRRLSSLDGRVVRLCIVCFFVEFSPLWDYFFPGLLKRGIVIMFSLLLMHHSVCLTAF